MQISRIAVFLVLAVFIVQCIYFYPVLPNLMASHFDSSGNPDRWITKPFFFLFEAVILFLMLFVFLALPKLTVKIPKNMVNLPNKDYWLTEERSVETCRILAEFNNWFCVGLIMLFFTVNHFVFKANIEKISLPSVAMWLIVLLFIAFTIVWTIVLLLRFRLPK